MRKLYSFLLLATTLLLSTNVMAVDVNDYTNLKSQIESAVADETLDITITDDFTLGGTITIQNGQTVNLDLKGHALSFGDDNAFNVFNGHLNISNSEKLTKWGKISSTSTAKTSTSYKENGVTHTYNVPNKGVAIQLGGTEDPASSNYSTLNVGDSVEISGHSRGIYVDYKGTTANMAGGAEKTYLDALNSENVYKGCSFGVRVDVYGAKVSGEKYGMQLSGNIQWTPAKGVDIATTNVPLFYVHSGAEITSLPDSISSIGIYCGGYGRTIIEGTVHAATGVYAKSGDVVVHDANIYSDADRYTEAKGKSSGVASTGSAILMDSHSSYAGEMNITITGDSKIEGKGGYAIESTITTATTNEVKGVTIEGGEFVSGDKGCMDMAPVIDALQNGEDITIKIDNTTFDNKTETGGVIDLLTAAAGDDYYVAQTTNIAGETVYIITETPSDAEVVPQNTSIDQTDGKKWITWTDHTNSVTIPEASIAFLSLEGSSHLTIPTGKILHVGSVVITTNSDITVEPGGQLIIDSIGGLVANQTSNLILQTSVANPAIFMMNPATVANTHPQATVEFIAHTGIIAGGTKAIFQRFGIPFQSSITNVTCDNNDRSRFWSFNMDANTWTSLGYINGNAGDPALNMSALAEPFDYYQLLNYASTDPTADIKYTMTGSLVGNATPSVNVRANFWNGYANSFMGKMLLSELLELIPNTVDKAVYTYDITATKATWEPLSLLNIAGVKLNPMQPFLIRNTAAGADFDIDYAATVYNPAVTPINPAPARRSASDITMAQINIVGGNSTDYILVAEDAQFSASFDNGYDAAKYMNEGINLYVAAEENMSIYATDNLSNAKVGFAAKEAGEYTLTFSKVSGDNLTLLDRETGARIAMIEGNTYTFDAVANTSNDERFVILSGRHTPTDAEEITAAQKKEGIFTILGEYVGAANAWNSLPAGVYVVNGEKRVK